MKYAALLLNILAGGMLIWGVTGAAGLMSQRTSLVRPPAIELKPLTDKELDEQMEIGRALAAISALRSHGDEVARTAKTALIALAPRGVTGAQAAPMPVRTVTLLAHQAGGNVAMVDGELVRVGSLLNQGGKVLAITDRQVTVAERNGKQILNIAVDSLRVGTLQAPAFEAPAVAMSSQVEAVLSKTRQGEVTP